jgi:hypothetical protein
MSRKYGWSLLLGISSNLVESSFKDLYNGLKAEVFNIDASNLEDLKTQRQITVDVPRTFAKEHIYQFLKPVESKDNALYNVLTAYAKLVPDIGYC